MVFTADNFIVYLPSKFIFAFLHFHFLSNQLYIIQCILEMASSYTVDELPSCVICLEQFLPPSPIDEATLSAAHNDIDTDLNKKNKSVSIPLEDSVVLPPVLQEISPFATDNTPALSPPALLGEVSSLSGCDHIYHDKCIKEWSDVTNSKSLRSESLRLFIC